MDNLSYAELLFYAIKHQSQNEDVIDYDLLRFDTSEIVGENISQSNENNNASISG